MTSNSQNITEIKPCSPEEFLAKQLIWQVFIEFEGKDYSQEGLDTFQQFISSDNLSSMRKNNHLTMWGYFIEQKLVGVIACKDPCHLTLLFVDKDYHHRGIAKHLLQTVINYYKRNKIATIITVNSSIYALEVYKKMGFTQHDTIKTYHGISFYPMMMNINN